MPSLPRSRRSSSPGNSPSTWRRHAKPSRLIPTSTEDPGDFSTIAGDLRMKELGPSLKIREKSLLFRRSMPCFVLQSTRRTPPWVSPIPRCYRPRSSSCAVEITSIGRVRNAASLALGIGSGPAPCMIWATRWGAGPVRSGSPTPSITALGAATTSPPTCPIWPRPRPATPIGSWPWPSGWWWEDGLPYQTASWHLWRDHRVFVPLATIQNWVEARGKKGGRSNPGRLPRLGPRPLLRVHRRRRVVRRPLLRPVDRR